MEPILGVNIPGGTRLDALDAALSRIASDGWQAAELNLSSCPLILGGRLQQPVVREMKRVMDGYALQYTAHVGYGLDLRTQQNAELHRQVMRASLEACAALGIDRLNFHYEEHAKDYRAEQQFLERMREACALGKTLGVMVNLENIEVEDVRYALDAVEALTPDGCGMTLDLGHLWISANYYGYDYLPAVRQCAPYVRHVHVNDNFGVFEPMRLENQHLYDTLDKGYRFAFSRGDIHIPPLWGNAPLREAFSILRGAGYSGIWLCEYYSHLFAPLNSDIRLQVLKCLTE